MTERSTNVIRTVPLLKKEVSQRLKFQKEKIKKCFSIRLSPPAMAAAILLFKSKKC